VFATSATQLIADAGPLGTGSGGHGHADTLGVCLQIEGHSLLIDPGTSEYVGAGPDRGLFRGTAMHNTLQVDGVDQAEIATVFSWRQLPQASVEHWLQSPSCDLFVASHDGYRRLEHPVTHRRWIISLKNGVYLVRDVVNGVGRHRIDIAWHLGQNLQLAGDRLFRVEGMSQVLNILPAQRADWTEELDTQMCSPAYGSKTRMTVMGFHATVKLPAEFAFLLATSEHAPEGRESFQWCEHADSAISRYEYRTENVEYCFMFNDTATTWRCAAVASDAKFVCHRTGPKIGEKLLFLCDGSYATTGKLDLQCGRRVDWAELNLTDELQAVSCSDISLNHSAVLPPELAVRSE
jgi:hypothetical protein